MDGSQAKCGKAAGPGGRRCEKAAGHEVGPGSSPCFPAKWAADLGVPEGVTLSGRAFDAAVGAATAHLGDPCLYCESPARLVAPGPCPKAGDHGAAILSLHRNLERNINATRIALEKATTAIGTACHDEVREDVKALKAMRFDVDALKRAATDREPDREPGPFLGHKVRQQVEAQAQPDYRAAVDAVKLNLGEKIERLQAEVDMAHRNRQRAQDEADRLRKETVALAEQAGLAEAKVSIAGAQAGAFDREASLKDRLLRALAERDEARCEATEARERVEELETQFAEEQDANDAEEADAKAARAALEAAQADFAKLADVVARFEGLHTGRGLFEVIAAIERMGQARGVFERDRKLLKDDANLVPHLKATLDESNRLRADLEARLAAAERAASNDPEAAARLAGDLLMAQAERDAAIAELADAPALSGAPRALGTTAAVRNEAARLARAIGSTVARGFDTGTTRTTYGRAANLIERLGDEVTKLRGELSQKAELVRKMEVAADFSGTNVSRAESRAVEAARAAQEMLAPFRLSDGVRDIAEERARQVKVEGFTFEHDDGHRDGEMGWAAACYAAPGRVFKALGIHYVEAFPWDKKWDKRPPEKDDGRIEWHQARRRALVKAGALCAAEVDRLDRSLPF